MIKLPDNRPLIVCYFDIDQMKSFLVILGKHNLDQS